MYDKNNKINNSRLVWVLVTIVLVFSWTWEFYPETKALFSKMGFGFKNENMKNAEEERLEKMLYWKNVITKQPSYQRAYLELAILAAEAGDTINAKAYIESAVAIDPNNEDLQSVRRFIESKEMFGGK